MHTQTLAYSILHCTTEGVLTQTHRSKNLKLTLHYDTSYLSPHHTDLGGTLEKKTSEAFLRVIRVVARPVCPCVRSVCGGRGTPYKGSHKKHQAGQLQQTAAFRSDKSEPPTQAPSMPPWMPPSRACSQAFLSVTEP